jgi:hypothetical protein
MIGFDELTKYSYYHYCYSLPLSPSPSRRVRLPEADVHHFSFQRQMDNYNILQYWITIGFQKQLIHLLHLTNSNDEFRWVPLPHLTTCVMPNGPNMPLASQEEIWLVMIWGFP